MSLNFISLAHAAEPTAPGNNPFVTIGILVAFAVLFYFFFWRPNAKRNKETKAMLASLTVGSEVLTNGGIIGTISKLKADNDLVTIKIDNNVEIVVKRGFIVSVLPQGTIKSITE